MPKHGIFVVCSVQRLILRWQEQSHICFRPTAKIANPTLPPVTARPSWGWRPAVAVFTYGAWACSAAQSPASTARHPVTCLLPPRAAAAPRLLPWRPGPGWARWLCHCAWAGCCLCCHCGDREPHPLPLWDSPMGQMGRWWGDMHLLPLPPHPVPSFLTPAQGCGRERSPAGTAQLPDTYPSWSPGAGSGALGWLLPLE